MLALIPGAQIDDLRRALGESEQRRQAAEFKLADCERRLGTARQTIAAQDRRIGWLTAEVARLRDMAASTVPAAADLVRNLAVPGQPTRGLPDFPTRFGGSKLRLGPRIGDQVALGSMAGHPPSGTVTFLLTDLEGSTRLWEQDPEAMKAAMVRHDELLEKTIAAHEGLVFARMGDGMAAAFATAGDAVSAAAAIQQALADEPWRTASPLRARIGVHTDEAVIVDGGYANLSINRCSRLMAAAHGGQVVISGATEALVRDQLPEWMGLVDLGEHHLRDLGRPTRVFQLNRGDGREDFPPLRSLDAFRGTFRLRSARSSGVRPRRLGSPPLGDSRVVMITGVGGAGKTRLALQVFADLLSRYRRGLGWSS